MAIPRPDHLDFIENNDSPDPNWGYVSLIRYKIEDQFNNVLPNRIDINEVWTSDVHNVYPDNNWRMSQAGDNVVDPADWPDYIGGEAPGSTPEPQAPQEPEPGNTEIQWWGQAWYVGSRIHGVGVKVQTNDFVKYRDHARHDNVVSPP